MEEEISFNEIWGILKRKAGTIITLSLLGVMIVSFYTFFIASPQFSSTTQMLVNQSSGEQSSVELNDINTNIRLIDTYTELITGPAILNEVSEALDNSYSPDQLAGMIAIIAPQNAQVFNLTVINTNPYIASEIANTVATTFQNEIGNIMNNVDNVVITYQAQPRTNPISPNHILNIVIGFILGTMIGIGFVFLEYAMDGTLRDSKFITEDIGWNDLGSIHEFTSKETVAIKRNRQQNTQRRLKRV